MNIYKIKWKNTGRVEELKGYTLKDAFIKAGLWHWFESDKYILLK